MDIGSWIKEAQEIGRFRLGIGIPHNFPYVPMAFFDSFMLMEKPPFVYLRSSAGNMDDMRNGIVREALKAECSHLIMMDTDQIYDGDTIPRLLKHNLPIVGCLVFRRYPPFDPLIFVGDRKQYSNVTKWTPGELIKVAATGTGCLMFNMDVFKTMPAPWFKTTHNEKGEVEEGEDFYFCAEARKAGFDIYVDTGIVCGHLSQMVINEGTWKLYGRVKEAELKAMHEVEHGNLITTVQ
jgi:GT2 family glycosyltransferase